MLFQTAFINPMGNASKCLDDKMVCIHLGMSKRFLFRMFHK